MRSQTLLDSRGNEIHFGYSASRPSWRKQNDALDRSSILESEDKVLQRGNRLEMLSTLRDLERNNPIARSIVQVFVSNLGQCSFQSTTGVEIYDEARNNLFKKYFKNCEVTGFGMQKVLQHIISDLLLAGEVFILLTKTGSIQLIPSERVASSMDKTQMRENESAGIVSNRFGTAQAYRICQMKDGMVDESNASYVPASNIIHISNNLRIGQQRGTPMLASATKTLQDIHEVQTAYTAKVKVSSALTGFITSNQPYSARWDGNEYEGDQMRSSYKKLYSGSLLLLENGESVQTIQGGAIDGVDAFMRQLISFACSSVGITMENLVGWSNASFSSSKATREVTNHRFKQIREMLEDTFLRRLARWRTYKFESNEEILPNEDREEVSFQWTRSPTLDRRQDAQTDALLIEKGLASKSTIFANNGLDFKEEIAKIGEDQNLVNENTNPSVKVDPVADAMGEISPLVATKILDNMTQDEIRALVGLPPKAEDKKQSEESQEELESLELAETYNDYPESASNNAKKAIKWKEENGSTCGTQVGWTRAGQLARREKISRDTIARMASFKRHQQHKDVPYSEGCGGIMWDAWGGTSGVEWAIKKLAQIDAGK